MNAPAVRQSAPSGANADLPEPTGVTAGGGEPDCQTISPQPDPDPVSERDQRFMRLALAAAEQARAAGEVPVGAVLVRGDEVIETGFNHPIGAHDPSAHAEMAAVAVRMLGVTDDVPVDIRAVHSGTLGST